MILTQAREDTHMASMKNSTQHNKRAEINNDYTVNTNKTKTLHNNAVGVKNGENGEITKSPQILRQQNNYLFGAFIDILFLVNDG